MADDHEDASSPDEQPADGYNLGDSTGSQESTWVFDLDNLPEEFTRADVGSLSLKQYEQLKDADLTARQRESLERGMEVILAPGVKAFSQLAVQSSALSELSRNLIKMNSHPGLAERVLAPHSKAMADLAENVMRPHSKAMADLAESVKRPHSKAMADLAASLTPKIPMDSALGSTRGGSSPIPIQVPAGIDGDQTLTSLAEAREGQIQAEQERVEREIASLQVQEETLDLQKGQAEEHKTDRRLQVAILIISFIALVVGIVALFR